MPARPSDAPDVRRRIDQAAVGRHVGDRDQLDPLVDHRLESVDRELPPIVAGHDLDHGARPLGHLEVGDVVAGVLRLGGQDAVAGLEAEGVERHVPGDGRVLHECDLVAAAVDQRRDGIVAALDRRFRLGGRPVAAAARSSSRCSIWARSTGSGMSADPALSRCSMSRSRASRPGRARCRCPWPASSGIAQPRPGNERKRAGALCQAKTLA